jgi:hypothetical protein
MKVAAQLHKRPGPGQCELSNGKQSYSGTQYLLPEKGNRILRKDSPFQGQNTCIIVCHRRESGTVRKRDPSHNSYRWKV